MAGNPGLTRVDAWRALSELALIRERKIAVADALGLSWTRVLAVRRLADKAQTQRETRRTPERRPALRDADRRRFGKSALSARKLHPTDRRAKLVQFDFCRARRCGQSRLGILDEPPEQLLGVSNADLAGGIESAQPPFT